MKMPTIEDAIEASGIEVLHPGGYGITRRIAGITDLKNKKVLDVASGRGTSACYYAANYNTRVTGIDINPDMVKSATDRAKKKGMEHNTEFKTGNALALPFADNTFDAVINEGAAGLTADPQKCLGEMVRVTKPGGDIVFHDNTWLKPVPDAVKRDLSLRFGAVPYRLDEWASMLEKAGAVDIWTEDWSSIEGSITKMRTDRDVKRLEDMFTRGEKYFNIYPKIFLKSGLQGLLYLNGSSKVIFRLYHSGTLGYYLIKGKKPR